MKCICAPLEEKSPKTNIEITAWAKRLMELGFTQKQCKKCRLWYFPRLSALERNQVWDGQGNLIESEEEE